MGRTKQNITTEITRNMALKPCKQHTNAAEAAYLRGGNNMLSYGYLRSPLLLLLMMTGGASGAWAQFFG